MKLWKWLSGKKLIIGVSLSLVLKILVWCGVPIPEEVLSETLKWLDIVMFGALLHKGEKEIKKQGGIKATINKFKK